MTHALDPEHDPSHLPPAASSIAFPVFTFPLEVDRFYASLIRNAPSVEAGLGGRLLYVGELDKGGRALMVAANIAGAASLAVTADPIEQKQAIRDGVADFLVTTLDEALRILKNEIRKREPVAVCVSASPASIEQEMLDRGVLPDLIRDSGTAESSRHSQTFGGSPLQIAPLPPEHGESIVTWSLDDSPAKWLPRLDAIATEFFEADESPSVQFARRWLRIAPRYLGRLAGNTRVLRCSVAAVNAIGERMQAAAEGGEIPVSLRIEILSLGSKS